MRYSLRNKLVFSYLVIAILTASLIFVLIRLSSDQRLKKLVVEQQVKQIRAEVRRWYKIEGNWDGFEQYFDALHPADLASDIEGGVPAEHGVLDADKRVLIPTLKYSYGEVVPEALLEDARPVRQSGEIIAWIVPNNEAEISLQAEEQVFLQNTNRVLLIAGGIGVLVALLTGFGLTKMLLRPITDLTKASGAMAQGMLEQEVEISTQDELGQLATSFNMMSHEIALANRRRRQLTADIAHDLRTPLHIALGYVETIQDGDLPATPERMAIIAAELNHLRRLIEDLDMLALTDNNTLALQLETIDLTEVLPQVVASFQSLAEAQWVTLQISPRSATLPTVEADRARLTQVLGNILSNALRFTASGGTIELSAEQVADAVQIRVHDSGVGIAPNDLPFIFDRFFQADRSRGQAGKLGLGLTISKGLVEAMGGEVSAASLGQGQGTTILVSLPASKTSFE